MQYQYNLQLFLMEVIVEVPDQECSISSENGDFCFIQICLLIVLTGKSVKLSVLILAPRQNKLVTGTVYPSIIKNIQNVTTR